MTQPHGTTPEGNPDDPVEPRQDPGKPTPESPSASSDPWGKLLARFSAPEFAKRVDSDIDRALDGFGRRDPEAQQRLDHGRSVRRLAADAGPRYADCTLDSFAIDAAQPGERRLQQAAVDRLRVFCGDIDAMTKQGHGLVLYGPEGTGKDHLMVACLKEALAAGLTVRLVFGVDLYAQWRDEIDKKVIEAQAMGEWLRPDILAISDPLPPVGELSEHQAAKLMALVHGRYRQCKPVWCTLNVAGAIEASKRLTAQITGRLRDGSLSIACNWPSHRKAL